MPAFVPMTKENARRPENVGEWCDMGYFDGLADPRGYEDVRFDNRKGYGLTYWDDRYLGTSRYLIDQFRPLYTYLELGCAKGFYVQAMRMLGVEAYGVDISNYATENCHPDIKQFLTCGSATNLSRFRDGSIDLVYSWDFLEHLTREEVKLCLTESRRVGRRWQRHGITAFDKDYGSIAECFPKEPQDPTHVSCFTLEWWTQLIREVFPLDEIYSMDFLGTPFQDGSRRCMLELITRADIKTPLALQEKGA